MGLPLYPIDTLQWKPGWVPTPQEEFTRRHDDLIKQERWIIDGWGTHEAILARFAAADTIILVDHPLYIHYWWAIKRQIKTLFRPRPDGPEGCPMPPMTWQLFKLIWRIHKDARPQLIQLVESFRPHKRVIHIGSPRQLQQFIRAYCQPA